MVHVQSLIIALLASQAAIGTAVAGERTTLRKPPAVSAQRDTGRHASKDAKMTMVTPLDRVATAVDGAESSHGKDIGMWRLDPSGPQGPMQVSEAAATDVGGGDRFDLTENRAIGRAYLAELYKRYRNWPDAIAAYNWGVGKMNAWVKAGRPSDKLLLGVATYSARVLHDSGLCSATKPKRRQQLPGDFDRSDAFEAAPNAANYSMCAPLYSDRLSMDLDKASIVALEVPAAGKSPPLVDRQAMSARASWLKAMQVFFGCSKHGEILRCR
jgi:hypothetical protein